MYIYKIIPLFFLSAFSLYSVCSKVFDIPPYFSLRVTLLIWLITFLEVVPIWLNNTLPTPFHFWKQSWHSLFGITFKAFVTLVSIIRTLSNHYPLSDILNFRNSQKLQKAMSGLHRAWESCAIPYFDKCCCTSFDANAGVLSWLAVNHHFSKAVVIFFLLHHTIFS